MQILYFLLRNLANDGKKPKIGAITTCARDLGISPMTVSNLWAESNATMQQAKVVLFKNKRIGVPHKNKIPYDDEKFKKLKPPEKHDYRSIGGDMGVSKNTFMKWVQLGEIRPHTNPMKHLLTIKKQYSGLCFCLSALYVDDELNVIKFKDMHNIVHIDEKWFYLTKETDRGYISHTEEESYRACVNKKYIGKLMFMTIVSMPVYVHGVCIFNVQIGVFPFSTMEPAKRSSKNRRKGTLELKAIEFVTRAVVRHTFVTQVIPTIKAKWPPGVSKEIIIQQDNAKPHLLQNDPEFLAVGNSDGFNMRLYEQPPNSPDLNILDLGFFTAIQTLQYKEKPKNVDALLQAVSTTFEKKTDKTLNYVFLSLPNCMIEVLKCKGHNKYKLPHIGKDRLLKACTLPVDLEVDEALMRECIEHIMDPEVIQAADGGKRYEVLALMDALGY